MRGNLPGIDIPDAVTARIEKASVARMSWPIGADTWFRKSLHGRACFGIVRRSRVEHRTPERCRFVPIWLADDSSRSGWRVAALDPRFGCWP